MGYSAAVCLLVAGGEYVLGLLSRKAPCGDDCDFAGGLGVPVTSIERTSGPVDGVIAAAT